MDNIVKSNKPFYGMSETGACSRLLSAVRLGYSPTERSDGDEEKLEYYSMLEAVAAQKMINEGYTIEGGDVCSVCLGNLGRKRSGIHIEMETFLVKLIGHLDRRLILPNGEKIPVEIKSLGVDSYIRFLNKKFYAFMGYAAQEACYLEHDGKPGIYWIMNRNTGEIQRYIVNDELGYLKNLLPNYDKFENITLPISYSSIVDKLHNIEIHTSSGELCDRETSSECFWCGFHYLCKESEAASSKSLIINDFAIVEASRMYREADKKEKEAQAMKEASELILWSHAKNNNIEKYKTEGISVNYRGMKQRKTYDVDILESEVDPEILKKATKYSKEYPDYTIRIQRSSNTDK